MLASLSENLRFRLDLCVSVYTLDARGPAASVELMLQAMIDGNWASLGHLLVPEEKHLAESYVSAFQADDSNEGTLGYVERQYSQAIFQDRAIVTLHEDGDLNAWACYFIDGEWKVSLGEDVKPGDSPVYELEPESDADAEDPLASDGSSEDASNSAKPEE